MSEAKESIDLFMEVVEKIYHFRMQLNQATKMLDNEQNDLSKDEINLANEMIFNTEKIIEELEMYRDSFKNLIIPVIESHLNNNSRT